MAPAVVAFAESHPLGSWQRGTAGPRPATFAERRPPRLSAKSSFAEGQRHRQLVNQRT